MSEQEIISEQIARRQHTIMALRTQDDFEWALSSARDERNEALVEDRIKEAWNAAAEMTEPAPKHTSPTTVPIPRAQQPAAITTSTPGRPATEKTPLTTPSTRYRVTLWIRRVLAKLIGNSR